MPKYQDFYNTITSYGFLPQIINPTRIKVNSTTIIDNIFSNTVNHNQTSGNILIELSDHLPQFLSVNRNKPDLSNIKMYARNYSKFSNESFRDDVSIQKWDNNLEDVNDQFNDFLARLEGCVDRHAPIKELNQREKKLINKPWITKEIIKLIMKRNCIFKNKKKADVNTIRTYNLFRNRINREIKNSKKKYYADYFTEHNNNIKKTWEGIRNIMNNNNISHNVTQLSSYGRMIDDPVGTK